MDVLSDIIRLMRLRGKVAWVRPILPHSTFPAATADVATFYYVPASESGNMPMFMSAPSILKITFADRPDMIHLAVGDLVVLMQTDAHQVESLRGHGATEQLLLCGQFTFDAAIDHPFIDNLPELMFVRVRDDDQAGRVAWLTETLIMEAQLGRAGSNILQEQLTTALFIELLRIRANQQQGYGVLSLLNDAEIYRSLQLIHAQPAEAWTVARLAAAVNLSRAAYAERFKKRLGVAPGDYLIKWRLLRARELLRGTTMPLVDVAAEVGYRSEAAFLRAYKRQHGITPARDRRKYQVK